MLIRSLAAGRRGRRRGRPGSAGPGAAAPERRGSGGRQEHRRTPRARAWRDDLRCGPGACRRSSASKVMIRRQMYESGDRGSPDAVECGFPLSCPAAYSRRAHNMPNAVQAAGQPSLWAGPGTKSRDLAMSGPAQQLERLRFWSAIRSRMTWARAKARRPSAPVTTAAIRRGTPRRRRQAAGAAAPRPGAAVCSTSISGPAAPASTSR